MRLEVTVEVSGCKRWRRTSCRGIQTKSGPSESAGVAEDEQRQARVAAVAESSTRDVACDGQSHAPRAPAPRSCRSTASAFASYRATTSPGDQLSSSLRRTLLHTLWISQRLLIDAVAFAARVEVSPSPLPSPAPPFSRVYRVVLRLGRTRLPSGLTLSIPQLRAGAQRVF